LNDEILLLSRLDSSSDEIILGKYAVVPLSIGRSGGIGARPENGALASSSNQRFAQAQYNLTYHYARIGVTGPSIAKSSKDPGAFLRVLKAEIDGATIDLKKDVARQLYGNGDSTIATVGTGSTTTVIVLSSSEAIDKGQLYVGQVCDFGTLAAPGADNVGASQNTPATISAVTAATPSITVSVALGTAPINGHFVFRNLTATASSVSYEMTGLQNLVSTTAGATVGGINSGSAGNEYWDNVRATTASLSQDTMLQLWARVRRASGSEPTIAIGSYGTRRQFFNLLQSQVRYSTPTKLAGGFESVDFNGLPLVADHEAPYAKLYMLNEDHLKIFAINAQGGTDFAWMNLDGDVLLRNVGFDAYEAVMHRYMQFGTDMRNAHGVLSGFTDSGV
jgi:hypothetical protein